MAVIVEIEEEFNSVRKQREQLKKDEYDLEVETKQAEQIKL